MPAMFILGLSILLQTIASVLALRLIPITRGRAAWVLIAAGLLLIVVRRAVHMATTLAGLEPISSTETLEASINLAVSALFLAGVWFIRPLFVRMIRDREVLGQQKEELATVMAVAPVAIWVAHDPDCHTITGNPAAREFHRVSGDANLSQTPAPGETTHRLRYLQDGKDLAPENLPMQVTARGGTAIRDVEFEIVQPDETRQVLMMNTAPLRGAGGEVRGVVAAALDITEHRRAEDALRQAHNELEERVRQRTEELRATVERLRSLGLELTRVEQRERRQMAAMLHDHLQQLLVAAKLNISAMTKGPLEKAQLESAEKAIVALGEAIARSKSLVVELSPPILREAGLSQALQWLGQRVRDQYDLTVEVDAADDGGRLDEEMRVVLFNAVRELLFNVIKHAKVTRARVEMSIQPDNQVRIVVADEGAGFAVGDAKPVGRTQGGFGLFAVRERLESLGGRVTIDSAPGRGSRVTLTVPIRSSASEMGQGASEP